MKADLEKTIDKDVLIIGGGAAGVVAAIEAAKYGVSVGLVDKGTVGFSGSGSTSGAGTSAVFRPDDSPEAFLRETLEGGEYLNDKELTHVLIREGNRAVKLLDIFGVPYKRNADGQLDLFIQLGQKIPRTPSVDGGGPAYMLALRKEALHRGVSFHENLMVAKLLHRKSTVTGCLALDTSDLKKTLFRAKAIVLAAGSATEIYPYSTASYKTTGDGYWLGWDAGLEFINMEFIEFSIIPAPNGIPVSSGGIKPLTARGAKFYNARGERFMEKYDPQKKELARRGDLVYGLYREIAAGRGPIYMDATGISADDYYLLEQVEKRGILVRLKECGVDYKKERFEWVSPAVHGFLGGLKTDPDCRTAIGGLYAAGENAGGVYGADRVGSFLTACAVFGLRAGQNAAKTSLESPLKDTPADSVENAIRELDRFRPKSGSKRPAETLRKLKAVAGKHLACERSAAGLQEAIEQFAEIMQKEVPQIQIKTAADFIKTLEIRNLCLTGTLIATAALNRKETRGQHRRPDYPATDPAWLRHIMLQRDGAGIRISTRPVG